MDCTSVCAGQRPQYYPPNRPKSVAKQKLRVVPPQASMVAMLLAMLLTTVLTQPAHGWVPVPVHIPVLPALAPSTLHRGTRSTGGTCMASTPTDEDNDGGGEGIVATTQASDSDSESESDRQELVDAIFKGSSSSSSSSPSEDEPQTPAQTPLSDKIDGFLDKAFFDPDAYDDQDDSFLGKLAALVKADYELFEAVFVACFFLVLITITKDLLRAQMAAQGVAAAGKLF